MCTLEERREAMMNEIIEIVSGGDSKKLQKIQDLIGEAQVLKLGDCITVWAEETLILEDALKVFHKAEHEAMLAEAQATLERCERANISFLDAMLPGENKVKDSLKLHKHIFWTGLKADPKGTLTAGNLIEKAQGFFKTLQDELVKQNR